MKLEPIELSPEKLGLLMGLFDLSEEEILAACNCTELSDVPEVKKVGSAEEAFSGLGQEDNCPACRAFMRQYIDFMNSQDKLVETYENICDCDGAPDERTLIIRKAATLN
jgi:hypothetical protein